MAQNTKGRPGRVITGDARYLVRINSDLFYAKDDGRGEPLGVAIPSVAWHGSYAEADSLCQRIKAQGFQGAVVVDIYGRMVDLAALRVARLAEDERIRRFWGDPLSA